MSTQKSILIVAAERGLGLGLAGQFFDRGWSVVGTARTTADDINALTHVGRSDPQRLIVEYIDVTDAQVIPSFETALNGLNSITRTSGLSFGLSLRLFRLWWSGAGAASLCSGAFSA